MSAPLRKPWDRPSDNGIGEGRLLRGALVAVALAVFAVVLVLPLLTVFAQALAHGLGAFVDAITTPDALAAIRLTILVAAIAVPLNTVFGFALAWCVTRFRFPGRALLVTLTELPFSVSPVVSGLLFVLLFGLRGWFGPLLAAQDWLVALQGVSGSGKTTLLRIIAGLEQADDGTLELHGRPALHLAPGKRNIGFVFQNYALFEHMSVFENVAFGLRVRRPRPSEGEIRGAVETLLTHLGLPGLGPRRPSQLSGGQRQRVAFARALAVGPPLLLLDEPFNALDEVTRRDVWAWLKRLQSDLSLTIVLVTHDRSEAEALADDVVTLEAGRIVDQREIRSAASGWAMGESRPAPWPQSVPG